MKLFLQILFFLSGAASLVYQVVWVRMLALVFGASAAAVATVIAAFMAGLALGSWFIGRAADRRAHPLRVYAALELGIGLFAICCPRLLDAVEPLSRALQRSFGEGPLYAFFRFALVFALLLVPTTLMGGTLPMLGRALVQDRAHAGADAGWLYAMNTLGAAAGCFVAAMVLLEKLGLARTIAVTAGVNGLVAVLALVLSSRRPRWGSGPPPLDTRPAERRTEVERSAHVPSSATRLIVWGLALSGCAALGYEVLWTRALTIVLRLTTVQSLSAILVVYLTGLACGSAVGARWSVRLRHPALAFAAAQLLLGLTALASVPALAASPRLVQALGPPMDWFGHAVRVHVVALAVMLAPTFAMGLAFPLAVRSYLAGRDVGPGTGLGALYAANTLGGVAGPFLAAFVLLPWAGAQRAIQSLALVHLILAGALVAMHAAARPRRRILGLTAVTAVAAGLILLPPADAIVRAFGPKEGRLVYHAEDPAGTVTVSEFPNGSRLLRVNGAGEVPTDPDAIRTFRLLGNLPMLLHADPRRALVIAFGGGITLDAVRRHEPDSLSVVEIAPAVVGAAPWFAEFNGEVWKQVEAGRIRLIREDGRNHLLGTTERYDVIVGDATHPSSSDSWLLYTREFYGLCASRLAPGGVFGQWLPVHGLAAEDFRTLLRTFRAVFPHATLWITPDYTVMLATPERLAPDLARIRRGLDRPEVRHGLAEVGLGDAVSLLGALALDEDALAAYAGSGPLNTDDLPRVSFGDRTRPAGATHGLPALLDLMPHLVTRFDGEIANGEPGLSSALDRRLEARNLTLLGVLAGMVGRREDAARAYERALEIDPTEPEATRRIEASRSSRAR